MKFSQIVSLASAILFAATTVQAVVLCAKPEKDGTFDTSVNIREACTSKEVALDAAALGLQGEPGPAGEGAIVVKDANGLTVTPYAELIVLDHGIPLWDGDGNIWRLNADVLDNSNPASITAAFNVTGVYYESSDCSGPGWVHFHSPVKRIVHAMFQDNAWIYLVRNDTAADPTDDPIIQSFDPGDGGCQATGTPGRLTSISDVTFVPLPEVWWTPPVSLAW